MSFDFVVFLIVFAIPISLVLLGSGTNPSWVCKIRGHKTFINTQFDEVGNVGISTERCKRCWQDVKELEL